MTTDTAKLRELAEEGTKLFPLPWRGDETSYKVFAGEHTLALDIRGWGYLIGRGRGGLALAHEEAHQIELALMGFVVAAVNALPAMCDEIDALRAERDRMREALERIANPLLGGTPSEYRSEARAALGKKS